MNQEASTAVATPPRVKSQPKQQPKPRNQPAPLRAYNVILIDDQMHTYDYVVDMLKAVFGYDEPKGLAMARSVDKRGRVIVYTSHKELAELKREQVIGFGPDVRMSISTAGMNALIEPAAE